MNQNLSQKGKDVVKTRLAHMASMVSSVENDDGLKRMLNYVPTLFRSQWLKSVLGKLGPKGCIAAKCMQCVGYEEHKERIGGCEIKACSLWHHRPFQVKR